MGEARSRKLYSHLDMIQSAEEADIKAAVAFLEMLNRKRAAAGKYGAVYEGAVKSACNCAEYSIRDAGYDLLICDAGITFRKKVPA